MTTARLAALTSAALGLALGACGEASHPTTPAAVAPQAKPPMSSMPWALPAPAGSQQPDLAAMPDGSVLLSWVEQAGEAQTLRFARFRDGRWSTVRTVVRGEGLGNSVDTPHVRATADGALWAAWLLKPAGGGYARDVALARSSDDGRHWSAAVTVNTDGTPTEHGFASLWPAARDRIGIAWLDGRATAPGAGMHAGHAMHHAESTGTATMLRTALFDGALARSGETAVDLSTCDCCQTDVAATPAGAVLAYRDRAPGEIRDIALLRLDDMRWSAPQRVHDDRWHMPACPVNGPALAQHAGRLSVAWYTEAGGAPLLQLAEAKADAGGFAAPVVLDRGKAVLGQVDVAMTPRATLALWLREDQAQQSLWLARVAGTGIKRMQLAALATHGRGGGVPRLLVTPTGNYAVWTDQQDGRPVLRGARIVD